MNILSQTSRWRVRVIVIAIALACAFAVIGIRNAGWLEAIELDFYDRLLSRVAVSRAGDARILLVGIDEADLGRLGWPLSDAALADLLEPLAAANPRAIGVDLFRDAARPPGSERLRALLSTDQRMVLVRRIGSPGKPGVSPPAYLSPERAGFADIMLDSSGSVRRGLLYLDDGHEVFSSLSLQLALRYLAKHAIHPEPDGSGSGHLRLGKVILVPLEANDGSYVRADPGGYQFLLDFSGGPAAFDFVSADAVISGRVPAARIQDRIVIVGTVADSVKDSFVTPLAALPAADPQMFGISLHAHATSQLLRMALDGNPPLRFLSDWQEAILVVLAAALGSLVAGALRYRLLLWVTLAGILLLAGGAITAMFFAWWIPLAPPLLAIFLSAGFTLSYVSRVERQQKNQLMRLFSRYVAPEVANQIWAHREDYLDSALAPRPLRLQATVLFSDIKGFTSISEQLSATELMLWLNQYTAAMASIVMAHGGMIDKFIGDAVMAVFGAPIPRSETSAIQRDAIAAVDCALAMAARLESLDAAWGQTGLPRIAIRIGIYSGPLVAGSLGSQERTEYTVIGDTVNVAARLESVDKDWPGLEGGEICRILVGDTTRSLIGAEFNIEQIGSTGLKGKSMPIDIYRVRGRS